MGAPNSTADLYELLQVSPLASPEVIEAAYKGLMRKYGEDPDPAVRERRRDVEAAYNVLSNDSRRAEYDAVRSRPVAAPAPEPAAILQRPPAGSSDSTPQTRLGGSTVVQCARDPEVQTALRCSRCDTPICPKCLIQTPVGARCKDCARLAKSPVYTVQGQYLARAVAAAVVGGLAMGLIWGFASRNVAGIAYGGPFISLLLGAGLGFGFTRIMEYATRRKRGPVIVACAMGGIVLATLVQTVMIGGQLVVWSILACAAGLYFAYQNLK